jgi:hypothetical protein
MSEQIYKLQPDRTISLRGFDALGASAAIHSTTSNSFQVSGDFRDAADFAVLILYDADNFYEHPRLKYLPDFNFAGVTLTFDFQYDSGLQPVDSPKFNWIDWATLDCALANGNSAQVVLWDHCTLAAGNFTAASGTFQLTSSSTIQSFDRVTLWFQDFSYDFVAPVQAPAVEYRFSYGGTSTSPSIAVNGRVYQDTTSNSLTQSSAAQASALVALINAGPGDPQVTASIGSASNAVLLTAIPGQSAAGVPISGTGNTDVTLLVTSLSDVATALAKEVNSSNWWLVAPTHSLRAVASGSAVIINAGRYGTINTSGTTVTWVSGAKFTGLTTGTTITINQVNYTIAAVNSPLQLTLATSPGTQTGAQYVADRGGVDGNMIVLYSTSKTSTLQCQEAMLPLTGGNSNVTWQCSIDFTALAIDQLRQCWLTFAPALANGGVYPGSDWCATFTNWTVTGNPTVTKLQVAGPNSVRVEDTDPGCTYTGAWATQAPETGFFSEGIARRAGSPSSATNESVVVTYSCSLTHDLYLGTSLYTDRGTVGICLDGDTQTQLNCYLNVDTQVNTRRLVRSGVAPGTHKVTLKVLTAGYVYFDFIEAAVASDVPDAPPARPAISPALDYSTDHSYKLPPARIMWIMDNLGLTGPVNQYIGILWYNQRNNPTAQFPTLTVTFNGTWSDGDQAVLTLGGVALTKTVIAQDTTSTIAAHFAYWINEGFVGIWANATLNVLTITARSPAYNTFTFSQSMASAAGTIATSGDLVTGNMGTWIVDPTQSPAINRGARDWLADLYYECNNRQREIVTSGSMELVNPPSGYAALFPDGTAAVTAEGFDNLNSTQCAPGPLLLAYQQSVFDCITDLQNAAGLTPNVQFGEYLWWYFTNYSATTNPNGGMAYFDAGTVAAAQAALGRPLHKFIDPNDDPTVNGGADAIFLRNRLRDHVAALCSHVKARYPTAQCEVLFPYDVNYPEPEGGLGGRLNNFVNFPVEWASNTTAGYDRLKVEALAFGGDMRDLDLALIAIQFAFSLSWPIASLRYLVPVFVQCGAWQKELAMAIGMNYPVVNLWAFDQVNIFGLDILAAANQARSTSFALN